jgi:hypothetical protein
MAYKYLVVGNERTGAIKFFADNQMREAEKFAQAAGLQFRQEFGVKRSELSEEQILAMINSNIALTMARSIPVKHDA